MPAPGVAGYALVSSRGACEWSGKLGTVLCVRCFPRGRGKRRPGRARSPWQFRFSSQKGAPKRAGVSSCPNALAQNQSPPSGFAKRVLLARALILPHPPKPSAMVRETCAAGPGQLAEIWSSRVRPVAAPWSDSRCLCGRGLPLDILGKNGGAYQRAGRRRVMCDAPQFTQAA